MVEACSSGVTRGSCALAASTPESARPRAVALVVWQGSAFLEASVRVGQGNGQWVSRELTFAAADPDRDRWVTVGLTVASLLDEARATAPSTSAPSTGNMPAAPATAPADPTQPALLLPAPITPEPARANRTKPEPAPVKAKQRGAQLGISGGGLIGKGWDAGPPMEGVWATLAVSMLDRRFVVFAGGTLAFSNGPSLPASGQPTSRWWGMEAGFGPHAAGAAFRFFAAPVLALQAVSADLGPRGSRADRELELKLRAGAVWELSSHWGLALGGAARLLPIESPSADPTRARRSGFAGELLAGTEVRL